MDPEFGFFVGFFFFAGGFFHKLKITIHLFYYSINYFNSSSKTQKAEPQLCISTLNASSQKKDGTLREVLPDSLVLY